MGLIIVYYNRICDGYTWTMPKYKNTYLPNMRKYQIECALLNNNPFENHSHASGKIQLLNGNTESFFYPI